MLRKLRLLFSGLLLVIFSVLSLADARAQLNPSSNVSGYARNQLGSIYQQSIGTGYTTAGLNSLDLYKARAQVPYLGQQSTGATGGRIGSGLGSTSRVGKPFSSYSPSPTVSPYLNLFRRDLGGNDDLNYNTLVRPQLQQQQLNQQLQQRTYENARRLQAVAAQGGAYNVAGSKDQVPTGHQTVFMYYGHYFPTPRPASARRQQ